MNLRLRYVLVALLAILMIFALARFVLDALASGATNACAAECAEKGYASWLYDPVLNECECRGGKA